MARQVAFRFKCRIKFTLYCDNIWYRCVVARPNKNSFNVPVLLFFVTSHSPKLDVGDPTVARAATSMLLLREKQLKKKEKLLKTILLNVLFSAYITIRNIPYFFFSYTLLFIIVIIINHYYYLFYYLCGGFGNLTI